MSRPTDKSARQKQGERVYFNLLRVIASELVLIGHIITFGVIWTGGTDWKYIQAFGVVMLIMISGYLIAGSVRRRVHEGTFSFWTFMRDRFARIYLPLLPVIPAVLLFDWLLLSTKKSSWVSGGYDAQTIIYTLLMLEDNQFLRQAEVWFGKGLFTRAIGSNVPLWAVALEWWLYVGFAGVVAITLTWRKTRLKLVVVIATLFALATIYYSIHYGNWRPLGWVVTAGAGWFAYQLRNVPRGLWLTFGAVGVLSIIYSMTTFEDGAHLPLAAIGAGMTIVAILRGVPLGGLAPFATPVHAVSRYSYSLFLVHYPVLIYLHAYGVHTGWRYVITAFLTSHIVAIAWWFLFERHSDTVRSWLAGLSRTGTTPPITTPSVQTGSS